MTDAQYKEQGISVVSHELPMNDGSIHAHKDGKKVSQKHKLNKITVP